MASETSVVVVGGGVTGLCCALYLHQRGCDVTLLEQGRIGARHACSYGNAGLVVPSHFIPFANPGALTSGLKWMLDPSSPFYIKPRASKELISWLVMFQLACKPRRVRQAMPLLSELHNTSRDLYRELVAQESLDCGFKEQGLLMLVRDKAGHHECQELLDLSEGMDVVPRWLDADQVRELVPGLDVLCDRALYIPEDCHLDPERLLTSLRDLLVRKGLRLLSSTEVLGFDSEGSRLQRVRTSRGDYPADAVVLATGAWSDLARQLKLSLPLQPAKGYSITVEQETSFETPLILTEAKVVLTPLPGRLRFSGTLELAGFDHTLNQRRIAAMLHAVPKYIDLPAPEIKNADLWAGLRPCTPDGLPLIGRSSAYRNLTIAAGHGMLGISLGPITGKLVAEIVTDETPSVDAALLSPERFRLAHRVQS